MTFEGIRCSKTILLTMLASPSPASSTFLVLKAESGKERKRTGSKKEREQSTVDAYKQRKASNGDIYIGKKIMNDRMLNKKKYSKERKCD